MSAPTPRAPRYRRWVSTGAVLGIVVALVATVLAGRDDNQSFPSVALYTGLLGALVGAVVGGAVALLVDRPVCRPDA